MIAWRVVREVYYRGPEWRSNPVEWDLEPRIPGNQTVVAYGATARSLDEIRLWTAIHVGVSVRESDALREMPRAWLGEVEWLQVMQRCRWVTLRSVMPDFIHDVDFDQCLAPRGLPISRVARGIGWANRA